MSTFRTTKELIYGEQTLPAIEQARVDMFDSLMYVIDAAGGYSPGFREQIRDGMTVLELIDALAQNGVRFEYDRSQRYKFTG